MHPSVVRGESLADQESYRWFIQECARDLRNGLERFVPDSPNGDGPLYAGTRTLLDDTKGRVYIWDNPYDYNGDVSDLMERGYRYSGGYGCEWFVDMDASDNTCLQCASDEHGIYLESAAYRHAVGLYADSSDAVMCEVYCASCNGTIKQHDDTELEPCRECEAIWAEVPEYSGDTVRLEVPTFERQVTTYNVVEQHAVLFPACGHAMIDFDQILFRRHMNEWYAQCVAYSSRTLYSYYGIVTRWGVPYASPMTIHCYQCHDNFIEKLRAEVDTFECDECGEDVTWERAYLCYTAERTIAHKQESVYVPGDGPTSDGIRAAHYKKACVA